MTIFDRFDRPLENLRISVTDRCNFRCAYCMPAERFPHGYRFIPNGDLLTFGEIAQLAEIFSELGIHKIRLTGGEPLVRPQLDRLVERLAGIKGIDDLAMSTNGYLLPRMAQSLRNAGLNRLNISLDTLDDGIFRRMNGGHAHVADVLAGIDAAERAGFTALKINTVVQRGVNDHTLVELAMHFRARGHIVRFIEYMDAGTLNGWKHDHVLPSSELLERISLAAPLEPLSAQEPSEVAQRYRYTDGSGEIGFITAVSNPFCGTCNRLRLSADGKIYTCLFAQQGVDLRAPLRSGATAEALTEQIAQTWQSRTDRYSELRASNQRMEKVEMHHIGG